VAKVIPLAVLPVLLAFSHLLLLKGLLTTVVVSLHPAAADPLLLEGE